MGPFLAKGDCCPAAPYRHNVKKFDGSLNSEKNSETENIQQPVKRRVYKSAARRIASPELLRGACLITPDLLPVADLLNTVLSVRMR